MNEQEIRDDIIKHIGVVPVTDEKYDELLSKRNHMIEACIETYVEEVMDQGPIKIQQVMKGLWKGTLRSFDTRTYNQIKKMYDAMLISSK